MVKKKAVIVDIDGTMALRGERDPYDMDTVFEDKPNYPVTTVVDSLWASGLRVIYCSSRFERARVETVRWLEYHTVTPYEMLLMRADGDFRKDSVVKYEMYGQYIEPVYDVGLVLDDRDTVVNMWRSKARLTCLQVASGDF